MSKQDNHENLPWYVNDQLSEQQARDIEQQLQDDPELQQEVEFLGKLRQQVQASAGPSPGELGLQRLKRDIKKQSAQPAGGRWKTLAVAASLLMVVQAGVMVSMIQTEDPGIVPLSGSAYDGNVLQMQFSDSATEQQIRSLLLSVEAHIIAGPSASGVYRVALAKTADRSMNERIQQLRSNSDVVDYVAEE